ncbi:uncharacterized protein LOC112688734 [Sipha flava]|jgi:hypothetical protein|uniref:MCM3-associated protein n=1 Tax=Sipha flava TaxID=143950 RepID=A0A2S2R6S4_9HEMI|nr:uncharacterized protein LOC112688734 [Sipha flava]
MNEGKLNGTNLRLKRTIYDEDKTYKDEPPLKSQRLFLQLNDNSCSIGPVIDSQYDENSEITEHNYDKIAATTLYKKLQVLEARDKIVRANTTQQPVKEINVDEIKPMEGTCQDMCPEKERLLRIHGNMVSQFECKSIDSKLEPNFEIMVKQYARSSADQANPLSHELRPTSVLVKTMNYMLKNIIYPIECNIDQDLATWYDFCWDRLRAIRKDIVQQNLQNPEVITILEQIGRFHIACYDLMLGYDGFDIKLNTENLNNCIQMLMPMYRDSDHQCPNEPEFVSYELLMHLGNPQFHTAYDLLPIHIKQSPQVRFCIKAHFTYLQSSDCIGFFNLLKSTTFMNCCILQRVIPNIRYNNVKMINVSYTTIKRVYKLDVKYLMELLCFNDIQSVQEFCSDIELKCDDIHVDLLRKIILRPPQHRRQKQEFIISEKRENLTFLISGNKHLPNVEINSVHSSFDKNDYYYDPNNKKSHKRLKEDLNNEIPDTFVDTDSYSTSNLKDSFHLNKNPQPFLNTTEPTPVCEVPSYTFKLPKFSLPTQVQTSLSYIDTPRKSSLNTIPTHQNLFLNQKKYLTYSTSFDENTIINQPVSFIQDTFKKPASESSVHFSPIKSPPLTHLKQLTERQISVAKKYFYKWQNYVSQNKSKYIEEMFAHGELFHPECISSLSSSPLSVKSLNAAFDYDIHEESKKWQHKQFSLAEKYFYIWLRKVLRKRRKVEIDPVIGMPWAVFMQVHGTPEETLHSMSSSSKRKKRNRDIKRVITHPLNHYKTKNDDISNQIANMFVKNVIDGKKDILIGKKIFWKLAVNYGHFPESFRIEDKVQAIIYGKIGFKNNQVQILHTDYNKYFIKSVLSYNGLFKWTKSGLNAALIFTNTVKENIESLFKRVDSILKSTPSAIPLVIVFSSNSDKNEIENYQSVLDAYRENDYINNFCIYMWEGPKTILEAIEFFSKNYVDPISGVRSEKLFYNLLNFALTFFLKMRNSLPEDNPVIIIEKYNQYLDAYIKRLGRNNHVLKYMIPEFIPYYAQNPDEFSEKFSNLNLNYFEDLLNGAQLLPCEPWPPQNVDDLIDYVKNMCCLTNRRCWCLDMLQMLQLHRKADLHYCLLNANWYEVIEMWIEGALEKCSAAQDNFTVFYNDDPITEALNIEFPNS